MSERQPTFLASSSKRQIRPGVILAVAVLVSICVPSVSAMARAFSGHLSELPSPVEQTGCSGSDCVYLPVVASDPRPTETPPIVTGTPTAGPSATATATPTITARPTNSPTPTPTATNTPIPAPANPQIVQIRVRPSSQQNVVIRNEGDLPGMMTGWTLRDAGPAPTVYTFKTFTLPGKATVRVWNAFGADTTTDVYWNLGNVSVWNDNGDTATLSNVQGDPVSICGYLQSIETVTCQ